MSFEIIAPLTFLFVSTAVLIVLCAARGRKSAPPLEPFDPEDFDIDRYRPMLRLLDQKEFAAVWSRLADAPDPGWRASVASWKRRRQLKTQFYRNRRRIFRIYLRNLTHDFDALRSDALMKLLGSPESEAALGEYLLRQSIVFRLAVAGMHARLLLHACEAGAIDAYPLLDFFERTFEAVNQRLPEPGLVG